MLAWEDSVAPDRSGSINLRPDTERVFVSYSHKDERWKDRLLSHLGVLAKQDAIRCWSDREIVAGGDWYRAIEQEINRSQIAILLISQNFLTSNFILNEEVPRLLERRADNGLKLIPVIVRSCAWQTVQWLSKLQARPTDGRPLASRGGDWPDRMLATIAVEILRLVSVPRNAAASCTGDNSVAPGAQPLPPVDSAKTVAILDRRLVTELLVAFSGANGGWMRMQPQSRSVVLHGLAHYNQLLVENIYASSLHQMFFSNSAVPIALRDAVVVTSAVDGDPFLLEVMTEAAELFSGEPRFVLSLSQYEKAKRANGLASSPLPYLFHNLRFAASISAALLPHPQRWPLYQACFECCVNRQNGEFRNVLTALPTDEVFRGRLSRFGPDALTALSWDDVPAMTLEQIGPCPFPYPDSLLRAYEKSELDALPASTFEFCVPTR
jgi:hypothetical protein